MRKEDAIKRYGAYYTTEVSLEHPFGVVKEHLGRKPLVAKSNPNTVSDQYSSYNDARIAIEHSRIMFVLEDVYTSICDEYDQDFKLSLDDAVEVSSIFSIDEPLNILEEFIDPPADSKSANDLGHDAFSFVEDDCASCNSFEEEAYLEALNDREVHLAKLGRILDSMSPLMAYTYKGDVGEAVHINALIMSALAEYIDYCKEDNNCEAAYELEQQILNIELPCFDSLPNEINIIDDQSFEGMTLYGVSHYEHGDLTVHELTLHFQEAVEMEDSLFNKGNVFIPYYKAYCGLSEFAAVAVIGVENSVNKPEESGCNEFNQATFHILSTTDEEEMRVVLFSKDKAVEYLNNWEEKNPNVVTLNSERQKLLAFNG
jgi:hypothetical protein